MLPVLYVFAAPFSSFRIRIYLFLDIVLQFYLVLIIVNKLIYGFTTVIQHWLRCFSCWIFISMFKMFSLLNSDILLPHKRPKYCVNISPMIHCQNRQLVSGQLKLSKWYNYVQKCIGRFITNLIYFFCSNGKWDLYIWFLSLSRQCFPKQRSEWDVIKNQVAEEAMRT